MKPCRFAPCSSRQCHWPVRMAARDGEHDGRGQGAAASSLYGSDAANGVVQISFNWKDRGKWPASPALNCCRNQFRRGSPKPVDSRVRCKPQVSTNGSGGTRFESAVDVFRDLVRHSPGSRLYLASVN